MSTQTRPLKLRKRGHTCSENHASRSLPSPGPRARSPLHGGQKKWAREEISNPKTTLSRNQPTLVGTSYQGSVRLCARSAVPMHGVLLSLVFEEDRHWTTSAVDLLVPARILMPSISIGFRPCWLGCCCYNVQDAWLPDSTAECIPSICANTR